MAFTDRSDLFAAVHENGINATIGQLMLQRPSLFNYATIRESGVMGFAVGLGVGRYAVVIGHTAGGGSRTVIDSRGQLPAGDLFAVTLITPGTARFLVTPPGPRTPRCARGRSGSP
jgi:hypothetical protein